eukprot:6214337-Pleurochrysis_carterae.AAC.1
MTRVIYRTINDQPLQGRAGFESVLRTDSLNHARLSRRDLPSLILYGIATRATIRDGLEPTIYYKVQPLAVLEAGTGAKAGTRLGGGSSRWLYAESTAIAS